MNFRSSKSLFAKNSIHSKSRASPNDGRSITSLAAVGMHMFPVIRSPGNHCFTSVLGAAIFVSYHFVSAHANNQPGKIVITQGDITSMVIGFSRTWHVRPHMKS